MSSINFNNIQKSNCRRWTPSTVECFKRNCICENCHLVPEHHKKDCNIKTYVLYTYTKLGKPDSI